MQEKLKQLELLVSQAISRLQHQEEQAALLRHKIRQQEEQLQRFKQNESELKSLREWKKNTVSVLRKLEARVDKEIARAQNQKEDSW